MRFWPVLLAGFCWSVAWLPEARAAKHGADCQLCSEEASGIELAMPLWLPLVGFEGQSIRNDGSAQRISLEPELEFAIVAEAKIRIGQLGLELSANGLTLGSQVVRSGSGEELGKVDLSVYFGRATFDWYTPPYRFTRGLRTALLAIWPYMGARYALLSGTGSSPNSSLMFEGSTTWAEPLFGITTLLDLRWGWLFRLHGDVGGFSVGSKISVQAGAELQFAATNWLNFHAGWTLYYARLEEINGANAELLLQGPAAGFGIPLF